MSKLKLKGVKLVGKVCLNQNKAGGGETPPPVFVPYNLQESEMIETENLGDLYGYDIAINANYLAVGAYGHNSSTGIVYIYKITNDGLVFENVINPPVGITGGRFGYALDMTTNWLVISAPAYGNGLAFVYRLGEDGWETEPTSTFTPEYTGTFYGSSVGIDGNVLTVGHYNANSGIGGCEIYAYSAGNWVKEFSYYPMSDDIVSRVSRPYFGYSIDMKGNTIAIGGPGNSSGTGIGTVALLNKASGTWNNITYLSPSEASSNDGFGSCVQVSENAVIIGSQASANYSAHLYTTSGSLIRTFRIGTSIGDIIDPNFTVTGRAGYSVSIKNTEDVIAVGAYNMASHGRVYIFQKKDGEWIPASNPDEGLDYSRLNPSVTSSNSRFGCTVEFVGGDLYIGAYGTTTVSGKIYRFNAQ